MNKKQNSLKVGTPRSNEVYEISQNRWFPVTGNITIYRHIGISQLLSPINRKF